MSERLKSPAETYKLNTLASALGRFAIPGLDVTTQNQAVAILDLSIDDLESNDVPEVPHTNPELLRETIRFDERLIRQATNGSAAQILTSGRKRAINTSLLKHRGYCVKALDGNAAWEMCADPQAIANAYQLPDLFSDPLNIINQEIKEWGEKTEHPQILLPLQTTISTEETRRLLELMWSEVIGLRPKQTTSIYLANNPLDYHLYWAPTSWGLDYATPAEYNRATQLSFDVPHNATHLSHLDALRTEEGAERYNDNMPQRAYFEAVAVFSEYLCAKAALENPRFGNAMAKVYGLDPVDWGDRISDWVFQDRAFEFKLRAVRYAADIMMMKGTELSEVVNDISIKFQLTEKAVEKEVLKYLPWTGLGAVYTHGYRKLITNGVQNVADAIYFPCGEVKVTWQQEVI